MSILSPKLVVLAAFNGIVATVCIYLGIWQLDRLAERRRQNEELALRMAAAPVRFADLPPTDAAEHLQVLLQGRFDFSNELLLVNRSRDGSPGVNIVTPFLREGSDTVVLVNRGWVYSPDGSTLDPAGWHEEYELSDSLPNMSTALEIAGRVGAYAPDAPAAGVGRSTTADSSRKFVRLTHERAVRALPYPVSPLLVKLQPGDARHAAPRGTPVPLPEPMLSDGPHLNYAIQWFAFAVIAVVGTFLFLRSRLATAQS